MSWTGRVTAPIPGPMHLVPHFRINETNYMLSLDCCVAAITMGDTSVWAFQPDLPSGDYNCFIGQTDDSCPAPATNPSTSTVGAGSLTVGNAYCGEIDVAIPIVTGS